MLVRKSVSTSRVVPTRNVEYSRIESASPPGQSARIAYSFSRRFEQRYPADASSERRSAYPREASTKIAKLVVSLVTLTFCAAANAGLRCNGDIADIGDSKASVLMKCGTPFFAQTFCMPLRYVDLDSLSDADAAVILGCFPVDEWSYNPGSGQFVTTMRFEAGRLTSIRYGDRIP